MDLDAALGRVLLDGVTAQAPLPPWDNSAMDGFVVRAEDVRGGGGGGDGTDCDVSASPDSTDPWLEVIGTIPAGGTPSTGLAPGQAVRIFTGAPVPPGADAVVMQEQTTLVDGRVQIHRAPSSGQNIRRMGEDVAAGQLVLERGTILTARHLGLAAAVGQHELVVSRRPTVGIIATGDELVRPPNHWRRVSSTRPIRLP